MVAYLKDMDSRLLPDCCAEGIAEVCRKQKDWRCTTGNVNK